MAKINKWADIWESRVDEPKKMSHNELLIANGYDNPRATLYSWNLGRAQDYYWSLIRLEEHDTIYEVGCGAGAFLYPAHEQQHKVGGLDLSNNLIEIAKINLPGGEFIQGDAMSLSIEEKWDHVVSFGLFFYFPDMEYVEALLHKMLEKANKTVCLYDLPDAAKMEECENMRRSTTPNYDVDYADLKHLYFDKMWFCNFANKYNLHLTLFDQAIPNYENGKYRFCVILNKNM